MRDGGARQERRMERYRSWRASQGLPRGFAGQAYPIFAWESKRDGNVGGHGEGRTKEAAKSRIQTKEIDEGHPDVRTHNIRSEIQQTCQLVSLGSPVICMR